MNTIDIEVLCQQILNLSQAHGLPELNHDDLKQDIDLLRNHHTSGHLGSYVLMLRTCGSLLFPLGQGVNPVHILHWIEDSSGHGQQLRFYLIDPGNVKHLCSLDKEKVAGMIQLPPRFPSDPGFALAQLDDLLDRGIDHGYWNGPFSVVSRETYSSYSEWLGHFRRCGNHLMESVVRSVLSYARQAA